MDSVTTSQDDRKYGLPLLLRRRRLLLTSIISLLLAFMMSLGGDWGTAYGSTAGPTPTRQTRPTPRRTPPPCRNPDRPPNPPCGPPAPTPPGRPRAPQSLSENPVLQQVPVGAEAQAPVSVGPKPLVTQSQTVAMPETTAPETLGERLLTRVRGWWSALRESL